MITGLILAVVLTATSDPLDAPPTVRAPTADEARRIIDLIDASGRLTTETTGGVRFVNQRRLSEAREELAQAEELALATYGPEHAVSLKIKARIGGFLLLLGRTDEARIVLSEAVEGLAVLYPEDEPELADARQRLLEARASGVDHVGTEAGLEARYASIVDPGRRVAYATEIAALHLDRGRASEARPWIERIRPAVLAATPEDAHWLARPALTTARFDLATGDYAEAEGLFMAAAGAEAALDRASITLIDAVLGLALAIQAQGRIDEAVLYLRDAQFLVRERDEALGAGQGQAKTIFAEIFRQSVTGLWRMADRIEARREASKQTERREAAMAAPGTP